MATVLIVDDSPLDRSLASRLLEDVGWTVFGAEHGEQALEQVAANEPDIVLTDMQMPIMDGLELVKELAATYPAFPVILMTAFGSEEIAVRALQQGAASYVPKDRLVRDLVGTAKSVLAIAQAKREADSMIASMRQVDSEARNELCGKPRQEQGGDAPMMKPESVAP